MSQLFTKRFLEKSAVFIPQLVYLFRSLIYNTTKRHKQVSIGMKQVILIIFEQIYFFNGKRNFRPEPSLRKSYQETKYCICEITSPSVTIKDNTH